MAIELLFNTKIIAAEILITDGDVNPIIDFDNVRYSIEISKAGGWVKWTPFNLTIQLPNGIITYIYPYAAHNILSDAIFGPSSKSQPRISTPAQSIFPSFPVPLDIGIVIP